MAGGQGGGVVRVEGESEGSGGVAGVLLANTSTHSLPRVVLTSPLPPSPLRRPSVAPFPRVFRSQRCSVRLMMLTEAKGTCK